MVFFWALVILIGMITADFFIPMLPSATLVTAAAGLVMGNPWLIVVLFVGAAGSSWFGEFMGYKVFRAVRAGLRRRPPGFLARLAERSAMGAVLKLEKLLQGSVAKHPYRTTIIARFLPAGRTTLAWIAAGAGSVPYGRMAALGGVLWAVYTVGLGLLIAWIAGPGLQSLLGSVLTVLAVGGILGWVARHWQRTRGIEPDETPRPAIAAGPVEAVESEPGTRDSVPSGAAALEAAGPGVPGSRSPASGTSGPGISALGTSASAFRVPGALDAVAPAPGAPTARASTSASTAGAPTPRTPVAGAPTSSPPASGTPTPSTPASGTSSSRSRDAGPSAPGSPEPDAIPPPDLLGPALKRRLSAAGPSASLGCAGSAPGQALIVSLSRSTGAGFSIEGPARAALLLTQ
ncbi:hypothetical protein [Glycomyces terrestris]|uniref:DedA family protein n=1 Tax=Glycomyces terrestris TaxID=2493553 RepID=A0A426UW35_9ACTN|nr:hypothetical protein [Glycomyces terrestris]RRR98556.1 hypothetical protein EIW28_16925 [Glycomyces terrestris]